MQTIYDRARICTLGIKNQWLLSKCLDYGWLVEAKQLQDVDIELRNMLHEQKMLGKSTHYIWHTQGDEKVRSSHARHAGKLFPWDDPPETGHPGEDYNCRCWAEPLGDKGYANQKLITWVQDSAEKWTDEDFVWHYLLGRGVAVTLEETGYLGAIIEHFSKKLGIYKNVNEQIIEAALNHGAGVVPYDFNSSYNFRPVLFTFRNSIVKGVFDGDAALKKSKGREYLVINGVMTYHYTDKFEDPVSIVEVLTQHFGWSREEAQKFWDDTPEIVVKTYDILSQWQTKFNATIDVTGR